MSAYADDIFCIAIWATKLSKSATSKVTRRVGMGRNRLQPTQPLGGNSARPEAER
jgi:hypothetical protein